MGLVILLRCRPARVLHVYGSDELLNQYSKSVDREYPIVFVSGRQSFYLGDSLCKLRLNNRWPLNTVALKLIEPHISFHIEIANSIDDGSEVRHYEELLFMLIEEKRNQ